jgi:hypothetical protein
VWCIHTLKNFCANSAKDIHGSKRQECVRVTPHARLKCVLSWSRHTLRAHYEVACDAIGCGVSMQSITFARIQSRTQTEHTTVQRAVTWQKNVTLNRLPWIYGSSVMNSVDYLGSTLSATSRESDHDMYLLTGNVIRLSSYMCGSKDVRNGCLAVCVLFLTTQSFHFFFSIVTARSFSVLKGNNLIQHRGRGNVYTQRS